MRIIKKETEYGLHIAIKEGKSELCIVHGGTTDLYWMLNSPNVEKYNEFIITKENYAIYSAFKQLFKDIRDIDIYGEKELPFYIKTEKAKRVYYGAKYKGIAEEERLYRKNNVAHYNNLFNKKAKTITWYSDETNHEVANYFQIKEEKETFRIVFGFQPPIKGYDRDYHTKRCITVRIRNSGSYYDPFNIIFMRMYDNMKNIGNIDEENYEMDIEEYIYQKKKKYTPKKTTKKADK